MNPALIEAQWYSFGYVNTDTIEMHNWTAVYTDCLVPKE